MTGTVCDQHGAANRNDDDHGYNQPKKYVATQVEQAVEDFHSASPPPLIQSGDRTLKTVAISSRETPHFAPS